MKTNHVSFGRRAVSVAATIALASSMCPVVAATAFADDSASVEGYVTCASYRAAEPTPEILGLSNVATNTAWSGVGVLDWGAPYYYIFGTKYNSNPNPYMVNAVNGGTPAMVVDSTRQGGPTASLNNYETSKVVWDLLPDTILGNNKGYDYNSAEFAGAAGQAKGQTDYKVYGTDGNGGVIYDSTNIYTMIDSMYNLATAGEEAAEATGKSLRYGSATAIAQDFELYVRGTQGYVLKQLAQDNGVKKTVALVKNYDATTGTYTLVATGVAEGTAAANRYLEACQAVATNLGDTLAADESGNVTCTAEQLAAVDLVLVGSQAGTEVLSDTETIVGSLDADTQKKTFYVNSANGSAGSCYGVVMNSVENAQNIGRILTCLYPEYLDQSDWIAYYYQNFYHLNTGSLAEVIANAMDGVRNWNNTGSEALNWEESDVADYSEFNVSSKIAEGALYIEQNEDELYSYLALTDNTSAAQAAKEAAAVAAEEYADNATVTEAAKALEEAAATGDSAKIEEATKALEDAIDSLIDISSTDVKFPTLGDQFYTGNALTPLSGSINKVKIDGQSTRIYEGTDYTVTYENNIEVGTATATLTGIGKYTGTKVIEFPISEYVMTVKVNGEEVGTLDRDQMLKLAADSTDNTEAAKYQYGTTAIYVPAKEYVTIDAFMAAMGIEDWESATITASDGFGSTVTAEINAEGYFFPAQTSDAYATDGAEKVPAIISIKYADQSINGTYTTAAMAAEAASTKDMTEVFRLFMGGTEEDYTDGGLAGNRFATGVCIADVDAMITYPDVDTDAWYAKSISKASKLGLFSGYSDGTFGPNNTLTRGQLAVVLWRYLDPEDAAAYDKASAKNETGMSDVADAAYYTGAANWAVKNGVITGMNNGTKFDPNGTVTAEQLCSILYKATKATAPEGTDKIDGLADGSSISSWAKSACEWAMENGVLSGYNNADGTKSLRPQEGVSRARTATILVNAIENEVLVAE